MERLTQRAYIFGGVLAAFGAYTFFTTPRSRDNAITEKQLEKLCPDAIGKMTYDKSVENPLCSYRMDETTYRTLKPFGIVARMYSTGNQKFDAVLIASASNDSFHDPHICFKAQGWEFESTKQDVAETKTRGKVPYSLITMTNDKGNSGDRTLAAYFYKAADGTFYGTTFDFKLGLFWSAMKGGSLDGVFYRVIPNYKSNNIEAQKNELRRFIVSWVDSANKSSNGYL